MAGGEFGEETGAGVEDRGQLLHCARTGENVACREQKKKKYLHHIRRPWGVEGGWAGWLQTELVIKFFAFFFFSRAGPGTEEPRNKGLQRSIASLNIPGYCGLAGKALIVLRSEVRDPQIGGRAVGEDQVPGLKIKATAAAALFSQAVALQSPQQQPSGPPVLWRAASTWCLSFNLQLESQFLSHVYDPVVLSAALMDHKPQSAAASFVFFFGGG